MSCLKLPTAAVSISIGLRFKETPVWLTSSLKNWLTDHN